MYAGTERRAQERNRRTVRLTVGGTGATGSMFAAPALTHLVEEYVKYKWGYVMDEYTKLALTGFIGGFLTGGLICLTDIRRAVQEGCKLLHMYILRRIKRAP